MFVPAEAFLSAALEAEGGLLEYAADRGVVLATPTTLIALLRTVSQGWSHQRLTEQAAEVQALGRDLHERLATMGGHLDKLGRSLSSSVDAYNRAVGSLEGRVLVQARRFKELGVLDGELDSPRQVESSTRSLSAPEFDALGADAAPLSPPALGDLADGDHAGPTRPHGADAARRVEGA